MNIPEHLRQWAKEHPRAAKALWTHLQDYPGGGMNVYIPQDQGDECAGVSHLILVNEVAKFLRIMDDRQVMAVMAFATHLKIGGVHPLFFSQIADALEDRGEAA